MAPVLITGVPSEIVAGDTLTFYVPTYGDFPISEGWTPSYSFVGAGVLQTTAGEITSDGSKWTVLVPATRTITLDSKEGSYEWHLFFTGSGAYSGQRFEAASGRITVSPDPTNAQDGDFQEQCEKDLAALEAVAAGQITDTIKAYTIRGRQVVLWDKSEIRAEIGRLKREVWKLRNPNSGLPVLRRTWYAA
jgi:hypothetical protein